MSRTVFILAVLFVWTAAAGPAPADDNPAKLEFAVLDKDTGKPLPCRIHLKDSAGKAQRAAKLPFWNDHFVCPGTVQLELPPGKYTYEIERGPEYRLATGSCALKDKGEEKVSVKLERLVEMAAEGWWCGDLHVHRPVADIELLMQAEDLHVAPVITWWNNRNQWEK